jgi:hypothetical protein
MERNLKNPASVVADAIEPSAIAQIHLRQMLPELLNPGRLNESCPIVLAVPNDSKTRAV